MIQSLKKKHLILCILGAVAFWIVAALIVICEMDNIKCLFETPKAFEELKAEDIKEGVLVKARIYTIYDYYSYYEEDGTITSKEYLIPVGEKEYMGMVCSGSEMNIADKNMQVYWDYLDGKDFSGTNMEELAVEGTIMPLEGESLRYYNEYLDAMEMTEEERANFLPYVLQVNYIGNATKGGLVASAVFAAVLAVIGIIFLINGIRATNLKNLRKYCREKGNEELYMKRVEQFYESGTPVQGIRVNTEYFMAVRFAAVYFAEAKDLIWVYSSIVRHSVNFIPAGKTYSLKVCKADGKQFDIQMKNERAVNEAIDYVARNMPYLIFGYDDTLLNMYNQNRSEMVRQVTDERNKYLGSSETE